MTLPRLLSVAVIVCTSLSYAQEKSSANSGALFQLAPSANTTSEIKLLAKSSEPWQVLRQESPAARTPLDSVQTGQFQIEPYKLQIEPHKVHEGRHFRVIPDEDSAVPLTGDVTCYTMRSYRVARDSKDSDSTHPAGYSTCQPTAQYRLKTTERAPDPRNAPRLWNTDGQQ